jgi:putative intracellular protease/amidase
MNILIVLTSQQTIGETNKKTGFHFSEFTHAYEFFVNHGYDVTVGSPQGGECPIASPHPEDKINALFYKNPDKMRIIKNTVKLEDVRNKRFDAVYIAGGHGTMFDLPNNPTVATIMNGALSSGGVVGAVCHGPAAFVGAIDKDGKYIVTGRKINSFTNAEEKDTPYYNDIPFLLESKLIEQGAQFESSGPRQPHHVVDGRIVTGQNPESVKLVAAAIHALLQKNSKRS